MVRLDQAAAEKLSSQFRKQHLGVDVGLLVTADIEFTSEVDIAPDGFLLVTGVEGAAMPDVVDPDVAPIDLAAFVKAQGSFKPAFRCSRQAQTC